MQLFGRLQNRGQEGIGRDRKGRWWCLEGRGQGTEGTEGTLRTER